MKNAVISAVVAAIVSAGATGAATTLTRTDREQNHQIRKLFILHDAQNQALDELRCEIRYEGAEVQECLDAVEAAYNYSEQGDYR